MRKSIRLILILALALSLTACNTPDTHTETPTTAPTEVPTEAPTSKPTETPTQAPTENNTDIPTQAPTENNTDTPTQAPTENNTDTPTQAPTENNTEEPTEDQTEYITVQDIVDEVFAGIDFDANIKGTIETLHSTRSTYELKKIFAFDYELGTEGKFVFYEESKSSSADKEYIYEYIIGLDTTQIQNYLEMSRDFEGYVSALTNTSMTDTLAKGSQEEKDLLSTLNVLKTSYISEKAILDSTAKRNIKPSALLAPHSFSEEKMAELGITDYNAFANMLLTNQNTEGLDQVTGWTMDDVIATYVSSFSTEGIDYTSGVDILILTNAGILQYRVSTQRSYGDTTDRYGMILNDDNNTWLNKFEQKVTYSENAVVYDENGERINDYDAYSSSEYAK